MQRKFLLFGSVCAFLAVVFGAFGAHGLKDRLSEDMLAVFQTGVQYQMYHGLALLIVAVLAKQLPDNKFLNRSGWLFLTGIVLFSGSLYALSLSGIKVLGAITPFGGVAFLLGWLMLVVAALKQIK